MGIEHHTTTGLLLLLAAVFIGVSGLFFTFSQADVTGIPEHDQGDQRLRNASGNLLVAYILAYVAAGITLLLSIVYFFQGSLNWTEVVHSITYIFLFLLVIISIIFAFIGLSDIDESGVQSDLKSRAVAWLWAGVGLSLAFLLVILLSGAWRFQVVSSEKAKLAEARKAQPYTETRTAMTFTSPGGMAPPAYAAPTLPMTPATPGGPIIYQ